MLSVKIRFGQIAMGLVFRALIFTTSTAAARRWCRCLAASFGDRTLHYDSMSHVFDGKFTA